MGNVRPKKKWGGGTVERRKRKEGRFKRLLTGSLVKSDSLDAKDLGHGSYPVRM